MEEKIDQIIKWIENKTVKTAFRLTVNTDRKPELYDTKFGGVPYWPEEMEYPKAPDGTPLALLAQLNMKDFSGNPLFPVKGILQFFIAFDDIYGADFDMPDRQSGFRVVWHPDIREGITAEKVLSLGITTSINSWDEKEIYSPFNGEYAVDVKKTTVSMGPLDYRYEGYMNQGAETLGITLPEESGIYDILSEEQYNQETEKNTGHWVNGYPYFTQNDPREYQKELQYYDTLLFQMDSDFGRDNGYEIIWGDSGVAGFFINHEDLKRRDFSKVLYNWDCC